MKQNEILDNVKNIDEKRFDRFMSNKKSEIKIFEDLNSTEFDDSWLDMIEECLPALDTIIRNPRKFIMQEEEVVPIEKAKKISEESIRHLAQHTNLIQDIDEKGNITPSSLLNIHKEESFDIYENRFVYSLLQNLKFFMDMRKDVVGSGSKFSLKRKIDYKANTKFSGEEVKIDLNIETHKGSDSGEGSEEVSVDERFERIQLIINDYFSTQFIRELNAALPVKSPIRKTNMILKDQNFKKILELWEFIERYDVRDGKTNSYQKYVDDKNNFEDKLGLGFYFDYHLLSSSSGDDFDSPDDTGASDVDENQVNEFYVKKLAEYFIKSNLALSEKEYVKLVNSKIKELKAEQAKQEKKIRAILEKQVRQYKLSQNRMIKAIKS